MAIRNPEKAKGCHFPAVKHSDVKRADALDASWDLFETLAKRDPAHHSQQHIPLHRQSHRQIRSVYRLDVCSPCPVRHARRQVLKNVARAECASLQPVLPSFVLRSSTPTATPLRLH
jgi:hypothetical protein